MSANCFSLWRTSSQTLYRDFAPGPGPHSGASDLLTPDSWPIALRQMIGIPDAPTAMITVETPVSEFSSLLFKHVIGWYHYYCYGQV